MKTKLLNMILGEACKHGCREQCLLCWLESTTNTEKALEALDSVIALLMGARVLLQNVMEPRTNPIPPMAGNPSTNGNGNGDGDGERSRPVCEHANPGY